MENIERELAAIEARAQAAAEGPWEARNCGADCCVWVASAEDPDGQLAGVAGVANAEFIAHACTDVPALIALVRHQLGLLVRIEAELHHAEDNGHRLDGDCQGVAPGQRIPAVRIDFIRAITATGAVK